MAPKVFFYEILITKEEMDALETIFSIYMSLEDKPYAFWLINIIIDLRNRFLTARIQQSREKTTFERGQK